jgi:predicted HNH restriction endonuclease
VHHITPIRDFDTPEEANTLDNLITLCEPCHAQWEGLYLRPDNRGGE